MLGFPEPQRRASLAYRICANQPLLHIGKQLKVIWVKVSLAVNPLLEIAREQ